MVSSKDQAKKVSQVLRHGCKEFFEDFYAKAEKVGRHPHPLEAGLALGQILKQATEGEWPPQPPDRPGVSAEVFDQVKSKFVQEGYHEAVDAWYRHTPGLEINKGKPGRPPDSKAQEYLEQHSGDLSYADIAKQELQQELHSVKDTEAKALLIGKESERIRASVRRTRRRQSKQLPRT
jgi:hypothetical protein